MLRPCLRQSPRAVCSLCSPCQQLSCRRLPSIRHRPHPLHSPSAIQFFSSSRSIRDVTPQTSSAATSDPVPLRKQLKQDAKAAKARKKETKEREEATRQKWELTVGIEIHAQLDTEAKLFSRELDK